MTDRQHTSPETCSKAGLSCEECTEHSAHQLAQVCKGLRGRAVAQLFTQIYPSPSCLPMRSSFMQAYQAANRELTAAPKRTVEMAGGPRTMAAVA